MYREQKRTRGRWLIGRAVLLGPIVVVFGVLTLTCCSNKPGTGGNHSSASKVNISFWTEPGNPRTHQQVKLHARISGVPANQLSNVSVDFGYYKFTNYKPEGFVTDLVAQRTDSGEYVATTMFDTATDWKVGVRVREPGIGPMTTFFTVNVGPPPR